MRGHRETHLVARVGWLRAAVLGANDGIVSTASLIIGVAAAGTTRSSILVSGIAGLVAGAMSMAAGEYVSVSSQADTERSDLAREREELAASPEAELHELAGIYKGRGLNEETARNVAQQMTAFDALGAHARDELHLSDMTAARPVTAALASAATFTAGAALPLLVAAIAPVPFSSGWRPPVRSFSSPRWAGAGLLPAVRRPRGRWHASSSGARWRWPRRR